MFYVKFEIFYVKFEIFYVKFEIFYVKFEKKIIFVNVHIEVKSTKCLNVYH